MLGKIILAQDIQCFLSNIPYIAVSPIRMLMKMSQNPAKSVGFSSHKSSSFGSIPRVHSSAALSRHSGHGVASSISQVESMASTAVRAAEKIAVHTLSPTRFSNGFFFVDSVSYSNKQPHKRQYCHVLLVQHRSTRKNSD